MMCESTLETGTSCHIAYAYVEGTCRMRSKTIKRFAILIVVLGLIGGAGFFAQRFQIKRLAQSVVEQADHAKKKGDLAQGRDAFEGALAKRPR